LSSKAIAALFFEFEVSIPIGIELAIERPGRLPAYYLLAVLKAGAPRASAQGRHTHVHVERATGRRSPIRLSNDIQSNPNR
jgi:acyl-CoA thioesterase FadM